MTVKKESIEHLINLDSIKVDEKKAHIILDNSRCANCKDRTCLLVCPAKAYSMENNALHFDYAGCLECGTCRVMCKNKGIVSWDYPRGTFGISYRHG